MLCGLVSRLIELNLKQTLTQSPQCYSDLSSRHTQLTVSHLYTQQTSRLFCRIIQELCAEIRHVFSDRSLGQNNSGEDGS